MTKEPEGSFEHEAHMRQAIAVAKNNEAAPFGAVIVRRASGEIVATGVNASAENPTWHGEIVALNNYAKTGRANWSELTLYTTAEPCCMCQGAIVWAGISEVVYGVSIEQLSAMGWKQIHITAEEVTAKSWRTGMQIRGDVLVGECKQLFLDALRERR